MCLSDLAESISMNDNVSSGESDELGGFGMFAAPTTSENAYPEHPFVTMQESRGFSRNNEIVSMLQKQQAMWQQVLKGQQSISSRQDAIEGKVLNLEAKIDKNSATSPSSSSDGKRKHVVTRTLSVSYIEILTNFIPPLTEQSLYSA